MGRAYYRKNGKNLPISIGILGNPVPTEIRVIEELDFSNGDIVIESAPDVTLSKVILKYDNVSHISENIRKGAIIGGIAGNYEQPRPKLHAPTISITLNNLIITPNTANGDFVDHYRIYINNMFVGTSTETTVKLSDFVTNHGVYQVGVKAVGTYFEESNFSNVVNYIIALPSYIYGVSGLAQESPSLTRTDDAINLTYDIDYETGEVHSDFNNVFPWNESTVKEIDGNVFLEMPDMWFRVGTDNQNRITDVAVSKEPGAIGNWYKVDKFCYGLYGGSFVDGKLASLPNKYRFRSKTRAQFRSFAKANGNNYFQLDLYHKTVMNFLWLIEFATKDSDSIMTGSKGTGTSFNTGSTSFLTTPSGFNPVTKQMRWHYIEDFIGNLYEWVDGAFWNDTSLYVTDNPDNYTETQTDYSLFTPAFLSTTGNCLAAIGWDPNKPFLCYGIEAYHNVNYNTGFCDAYYYDKQLDSAALFTGSAWNNNYVYNGVTHFSRSSTSHYASNIGARLLYKERG
jgi:hypothetical protein